METIPESDWFDWQLAVALVELAALVELPALVELVALPVLSSDWPAQLAVFPQNAPVLSAVPSELHSGLYH